MNIQDLINKMDLYKSELIKQGRLLESLDVSDDIILLEKIKSGDNDDPFLVSRLIIKYQS